MAEVGRDDKFFQYSTAEELRNELVADRKGKGVSRKRAALKRIIANATMGNDMHSLFAEVVECLEIDALDVKKMVCTCPTHTDLYIINYGRSNKKLLPLCIKGFLRDCNDPSPSVRALALRSMSYLQSPQVFEAIVQPVNRGIRDKDAQVRKAAVICIAKMHMFDPALVEANGYVEVLQEMLFDENINVVSNAVVALYDMVERSDKIQPAISFGTAEKLARTLGQCSEWGQTYILEILIFFVPQTSHEAEAVAELAAARLQQTSLSVVLTAVKVVMYLLNYISSTESRELLCRKVGAALVTLLSSPPEMQYVALRNILLVIQRRPIVLHNNVQFFFRKPSDPLYIKLTKLEVLCRLVHRGNAQQVLPELQDYTSDAQVDFTRKAVNTIGRIALRIEEAADQYVGVLTKLVKSGVHHIVQEVMIIAKDIFRKYPNRYMDLLKALCAHIGELEETQAKAAMIWILGQYADRIEKSEELLDEFLYTFLEEPVEIQLALLTATVKLFLKRPTAGSALVPKVLKWATQDVRNPDCRDRGYMYFRLLSSDAAKARKVILTELPVIDTHSDRMDRQLLDQLLLQGNSLASVYFRTPQSFIQGAKGRYLPDSSALEANAKLYASDHLYNSPQGHPPDTHVNRAMPLAPISTSMSMGLSQALPDNESIITPNESLVSEVSATPTDEDLSGTLSHSLGQLQVHDRGEPGVGSLI